MSEHLSLPSHFGSIEKKSQQYYICWLFAFFDLSTLRFYLTMSGLKTRFQYLLNFLCSDCMVTATKNDGGFCNLRQHFFRCAQFF